MTPDRNSTSRPRGLSLERTLPLVITALLLVVLGIALAVTHREVMRSAQSAASERLANADRELAAGAATAVHNRGQTLMRLGADSLVRRALTGAPVPSAELSQQLRRLIPGVDSGLAILLWDAQGRPLPRLQVRDTPERGADDGDRAIPPRNDSAHVGPLFVSDGRTYFWTTAPVLAAGHRIGWIGERRQIRSTPTVVREIQALLGGPASVYFRNDSGSLWSTLDGHPTVAPVVAGVDGKTQLWHRPGDPDAGPLLAVQQPIAGTPFMLSLELPLGDAIASARAAVLRLALFSLLLLIAAGVAAWAISRWLTRPLVELSDAAVAIARGEYTTVDETRMRRGDEVGLLAGSFNHMVREISASHAELEQQLEEAQSLGEEIEHANTQLQETTLAAEEARDAAERARHDAEQANRAKSEFLAMMSHELRTPLNAIVGYVELLQMQVHGPITPEQNDDLERIRRSQRTLLSLIDDVLSFARIEAGRMEYRLAPVSLDDTLSSAEALIAPQVRAKAITYRCELTGTAVQLFTDREKLERIVINLLSNAVKFTEPGGRVTLRGELRPDDVYIRVEDTGCGIAPEKVEAIFEPFTQAEVGLTRTTEGTGLGLAISREFARALGGDLLLESTSSGGSSFLLRLPRRAGSLRVVEPPGPVLLEET